MRSAPDDASLAVAKRIPVHMKLTMDRQHVDELLVACGESPLPLVVRKVRLDSVPLPDRLAEAFKKEAADKTRGDGNQGRQPQIEVPHSVDVAVELDGLIYMCNPVEK